ncbi:MAG TPA: STAS domain-containing protein [Streptosporangiaceae bacterium]
MPDVKFPTQLVAGVPVVAAPEEIDITNAEEMRSALLKAAANGQRAIVMDMTQTKFCDSYGLNTLVAAHRRAEAEGRELLAVIPGSAVLRIFALTGIDRVIPNFASLADALAEAARREVQAMPDRKPLAPDGQQVAAGVAAPAASGGLDQ